MNFYLFLLLVFGLWRSGLVDSLGCMKVICSNQARNPTNEIVQCSASGYCGTYKGLRNNQQFVEAVDLSCSKGSGVFAPFDGEISFYRPLGDSPRSSCGENHGVRIEGHGQWRGYHALISSVKPFKFGGNVKAGAKIGTSGNLECFDNSESNFVRFQLFRQGKSVDPTYHLVDCMCTGQICETNRNNVLVGIPFKYDSRYNGVRGWELKCNEVDSESSASMEYVSSNEEENRKAPEIYSPIDGNVIGRIRLEVTTGGYSGCGNEGIFVKGTGKWMDYEVRIYNARFRENLGLGQQRIEQGQHIGYRLLCDDAPESIFIEVRFHGTIIDISDALSATDCRHRKISRLQ